MKKFLGLALAFVMALSLAACSRDKDVEDNDAGSSEEVGFTFTREIEIICPWGDTSTANAVVQQFASQLEKELGQSVVVNNVIGAGGVSGVEYAVQQPSDGYTWLICSPSPMLAQITRATDYDVYGSVKPVCNLVRDCNVFVAGKDAPYNNYQELRNYLAAYPGSVRCGVTSATGLDGACVLAAFGGAVTAEGYFENAQLYSDVIDGKLGLACVGSAGAASMIQSGDMKVIMTCTEERMTRPEFAEAECAGELELNCFYGAYYGIFCKKGMPQDAIDAFVAAAEKVVASEKFQNWAGIQCLDQRDGWMDPAAYQAQWDADYEELSRFFG